MTSPHLSALVPDPRECAFAVRDLAKNSSEEWQPLEEQVWEYDASTDSRVHPLEENRGEASSDERHS